MLTPTLNLEPWGAGHMASDREIVAGYFAKAEDANQAIRELMDEGFGMNEIGAAFHDGSSPERGSASRSEGAGRSFEGDMSPQWEKERILNLTGPTSGTEAVRPWGLFTGGGMQFMASGREPREITGSEIPPDLPRDIPSEFDAKGESRASSQIFSCSACESSFAGMGIPADHARRLARELRGGGAVVTVKAGERATAAERIMEREHGRIRYESAPVQMETGTEDGGRVDVFGEVHRVYPNAVRGSVSKSVTGEDAQERKAS